LSDRLIFLGTAGGRASVFRYLRRSGGFLLRLSDLWVHTDPGPGAFVYLHQMGFDPRQINCVVLSHIHLDHSADINSVIESATDGGKKREVVLFAPRSALEGENRVVLPFIRKERLAGEFILEEGRGVQLQWSPHRGGYEAQTSSHRDLFHTLQRKNTLCFLCPL
jgi:Metal-dependent hydrolases of the beta-lactamase superfamily III